MSAADARAFGPAALRGFDPAQGRWTFPGGFVDLGESVEDAAHRETNEELRILIELGPLVGVYSRAEDRVVLIVFLARALGRPQTTPEATEVRSFAAAEIPWDELAFWSTHQALRDALGPGKHSADLRQRRAHRGEHMTHPVLRHQGLALRRHGSPNARRGPLAKTCERVGEQQLHPPSFDLVRIRRQHVIGHGSALVSRWPGPGRATESCMASFSLVRWRSEACGR